jgi:hypothetical protein
MNRSVFEVVRDDEDELLKWYVKAENIAAEVKLSSQKTRAEYATKAEGAVGRWAVA